MDIIFSGDKLYNMNCSSTNGRLDIMAPNKMNQFDLLR